MAAKSESKRLVGQSVGRSTAGTTASMAIKFRRAGRAAAARERRNAIVTGAPDGGQRPERQLDGDQVGDDLDGPLAGARPGGPLGTLRLARASSAHDAPLPVGGSEGAQPPASPARGPAKRGPSGYAGLRTLRVLDSSPASAPDGLRGQESRDDEISIPYTERLRSGGVNRLNQDGFPRVPAPSRSRISLRRRHLRQLPDERKHASLGGSGGLSTRRAPARRELSLDARAGSTAEGDSTIVRTALLGQADSGLLGLGGYG